MKNIIVAQKVGVHPVSSGLLVQSFCCFALGQGTSSSAFPAVTKVTDFIKRHSIADQSFTIH